MNKNYARIITLTFGWLTINSIHAAPPAPPFVVNGTTVTTPNASGTYNHSFFKDPTTGYSVLIEPVPGQTLVLKNKGSVISIGDTSTVTIDGLTTLKSTNDVPVINIKGSGSVTNNGGKIIGGEGINITKTGTVTNSGKIKGTDYGVQIKTGTVTNTSTGIITAQNGGDGVAITGDKNITVINQGTLKGDYGIGVNGGLTVNNSGSIKAVEQGIASNGDATITNSGKILSGQFQAISIQKNGTVTNSGKILSQQSDAIVIENNGTVTNSGKIISEEDDAIDLRRNGTVTNTGLLEGFEAVFIEDKGTVANSGRIFGFIGVDIGSGQVTNSGLISAEVFGVTTEGAGTLINSGKIVAEENGVSIGGKAHITNSGTIKGQNEFGVEMNSGGTLANSGAITGGEVGILAPGGDTTILNSGTIRGDEVAVVLNKGSVTNSGKIVGDGAGIAFNGNGTVTNSGRIKGKSGPGIQANDKATIILQGGSVKGAGGAPAIVTNTLGGNKSSVTIQGRAKLNGGILSEGKTGKLTLNLVGMTPAEAAAIDAMSGQKNGDFFIGSHEYEWSNYKMSAHAVSLETVVDPGLEDIAIKIDNTNQGLSQDFDPLYVAAATDPEAALNNFTGREFLNAFNQVGLSTATTFSSLADERAFSIRSGASGVDLSGLDVNSGSLIASLDNVRNVLNQMSISDMAGTTMSDSKEAMFTNSPDLPWGVWASGAVSVGNDSGSFSDPGYHTIVGSPTIGFDYHLFPEFVVGALVNYTTTDVSFLDESHLNADTYLFGGYADWSHDHWFANGLVAGGFNKYDQTRTTLGNTNATSSPDGSEVLSNISGGYDFKFSGWTVSPEAGLNYTHLEKDSYSESGGGAFDLNEGEQDVNSLRTKLGFNATNVFKWDGMKFAPDVHADWYHECLDDTTGVSASVPGAPALGSFITTTTPIGRNFALVGAGLSITPDMLHDQVTFFLNYDAQVGQNNYISHTGDGGLRIGF